MRDNRDNMYFPGPQGMPMQGMPMGMGQGMPMQGMPMQGAPGGMMPNVGQLESRVATLERQVRRLEARLSRIETPYPAPSQHPFTSGTGTFPGAEPAEQSYPYQTSMQVM